VAFSPDGTVLAAGGYRTGKITLWSVLTRRVIATLTGHRGGQVSLAFSRDGKWLASGCADYTVRLWALATRELVATLRGHRAQVGTVAFSPDGRTLVSGGQDGLKFWRVAPMTEDLLTAHRTEIDVLAFSADGKILATAGADGTVRLWDVATRRNLATLRGHRDTIYYLAFSPDGRWLASGSAEGVAKVWDLATRRAIATMKNSRITLHLPVVFSPDSQILARGADGPSIRFWNVRTRREVAVLKGHTSNVTALAFSPDGSRLASGSLDGTARIWDVMTRRQVVRLGHINNVYTLAFSPDGRHLVTGGADPAVRVWEVATGRHVASLRGHTSEVQRLGLSPDGKTLATNAVGDPVTLYSTASWQEAASLKDPALAPSAIAFSPDNNLLAIGRVDGRVHFWRAPPVPEVDPLHGAAGGGDQSVFLQWTPVPGALGYNVYRRLAGVGRSRLVRLNVAPVAGSSFADRGPGLVNGRSQTYQIAPLFTLTKGARVEGPRLTRQAIPGVVPPGTVGWNINESGQSGQTLFDPATDTITLRGSGEIASDPGSADSLYLLGQTVAGDFRVTITLQSMNAAADAAAGAGLMVRESLERDARSARVLLDPGRSLGFVWRFARNDVVNSQVLSQPESAKLPVVLRLTRRGDVILPEYSRDGRIFGSTRRCPGHSWWALWSCRTTPTTSARRDIGTCVSRSFRRC
jgi:WD40 repeat protein